VGGVMRPLCYGVVWLLCLGGCIGPTHGKLVGVMDLDSRSARFSLIYSIAAGSPSDTFQALVGITVDSSASGERLGADCPRLSAVATVNGVVLPKFDGGGTVQCGISGDPDCGKLCRGALWTGDLVATLGGFPSSIDVAIADSSGQIGGPIPEPMPRAQITFEGLSPGQTVHSNDEIAFQLAPFPPLLESEVNSGADTSLPVTMYVHLTPPAGGWRGLVEPGPTRDTSGPVASWRFRLMFGVATLASQGPPPAGPAALEITLARWLDTSGLDAGTSWTAVSSILQVRFPVEYQP
jgi:hypothetical protein